MVAVPSKVLLVLFLCHCVCAEVLESSPVLSPSKIDNRIIKKDINDKLPAYTTKIKKSKYFHHHYIYHNSNKFKKNQDHDHEIKVPTDERVSKLYHIIDINKDDIITDNELRSLLHIHKYPQHHPQHDQLIKNAKTKMDLNSDGIIEKHEYLQSMKQSTKAFSNQLLFAEIPKEDLSKFENLH